MKELTLKEKIALRDKLNEEIKNHSHIVLGSRVKLKDGSYIMSIGKDGVKHRYEAAPTSKYANMTFSVVFFHDNLPTDDKFSSPQEKNNIIAISDCGHVIFCQELNLKIIN